MAAAACCRRSRAGPRSPSGWKNSSGSAPRQALRCCHCQCSATGPGRPCCAIDPPPRPGCRLTWAATRLLDRSARAESSRPTVEAPTDSARTRRRLPEQGATTTGQGTLRSLSCAATPPYPERTTGPTTGRAHPVHGLPVHGPELRADDVALVWCWSMLVVHEVPGVPDDHVGAVDWLPGQVLVEPDLGLGRGAADYRDPVVELGPAVAQEPQVRDAVGVRRPVGDSRCDPVPATGLAVVDLPGAREEGPLARGLPHDRRPRRSPGEEQTALLDDVTPRSVDVEVQPPEDVVLVTHAGARVAGAGEAEPGADRSVVAQPPVRHVAVPAGLKLADHAQLALVVPERDALEVPRVGTGFQDRGWWLGAHPPSRPDRIGADRLERRLLVLPVAVGHAVVVEHVEDRHVCLPEHQVPAVAHLPQFHPRALAVSRGGGVAWPDHDKAPQLLAAAQDPHPHLARAARVGKAAHADRQARLAVVVGRRVHSNRLPVDQAAVQVDRDHAVQWTAGRVEDSQRYAPCRRAVLQLDVGQRRHGLVHHDAVPALEWRVPIVGTQHLDGVPQLVLGGVGAEDAGPYVDLLELVRPAGDLDGQVAARVEHRGHEAAVTVLLAPQHVRVEEPQLLGIDVPEPLAHSGMPDDDLTQPVERETDVVDRIDENLDLLGHGCSSRSWRQRLLPKGEPNRHGDTWTARS